MQFFFSNIFSISMVRLNFQDNSPRRCIIDLEFHESDLTNVNKLRWSFLIDLWSINPQHETGLTWLVYTIFRLVCFGSMPFYRKVNVWQYNVKMMRTFSNTNQWVVLFSTDAWRWASDTQPQESMHFTILGKQDVLISPSKSSIWIS